jgi:hypothetical protein
MPPSPPALHRPPTAPTPAVPSMPALLPRSAPPLKPKAGYTLRGRQCLNCGQPVEGAFCGTCGQEYDSSGEISVRLTFRDLVDDLVQVNREFLRTVWRLIRRPGQLTLDFLAGKRAGCVSPSKLFLVVNFVTFMLAQWLQPESTKDIAGMVGMAPVEAGARIRDVSIEHFGGDLEGRLGSLVPAYFFVLVPVFALGMMLLYAGTRRPFAAHAAFSFHFFSFALLALIPDLLLTGTPAEEPALMIALFLLIPLWTALAMHRVYGDGWGATIARAGVAWVFFIGFLMLYYLGMIWLALLTA